MRRGVYFTHLLVNVDGVALQLKAFFKANKVALDKVTQSGTIYTEDKKLHVSCSDGWLEITELQMAGKKRMDAKSFLLGFDLSGFNFD